MRKGLCILMLFCMLCCNACSSGSTEAVRQDQQIELVFSWWGNDNRHEYTIDAIQEFEKRHPKIKVTLKYGSWNGFEDRMRMELMSDTEADVMQINYSWLKEYSPDGNRFFNIYNDRGDIDLVSFSDEEEAMGMVNGKLNALPIAMNAPTFYWNKTLFDSYDLALPATWDDLFAAAEKMAPDGVYPLCTEPQFAWFISIAYVEQQTGRKLMGEEGDLLFTQADVQKMLEFYSRLVAEKVIYPVDIFDKSELLEEHCAGVVAWTNSAESCCNAALEKGYEMTVGDLPMMQGAKRNGWYYKPSAYYAVSANSEHPKEAVLLMNFLLNSKEMILEQKLEKGVPLSDAAQKVLVENDLLNGLPYEAFQKMDAAVPDMEMESSYLETAALMSTFTATAQEAAQSRGDTEKCAREFYRYMGEKAYLAPDVG